MTDYPLTLRNVSGSTADVLYNATLYKNEAGEVQGVFAAARNITERKRQEDIANQRTEALANVLMEVKETVNILVSSSTEILAATTQVAAGTAETVTAIGQTTAAVEEVGKLTAKESARIAKSVADSAMRAAKVSQTGQGAVEETVKGMNRIREQMDSIAQTVVRLSEQSQSIGDIITSVTDIADQSNLLPSTQPLKQQKPGNTGEVLLSWHRRSGILRNNRNRLRRRSGISLTMSKRPPEQQCWQQNRGTRQLIRASNRLHRQERPYACWLKVLMKLCRQQLR